MLKCVNARLWLIIGNIHVLSSSRVFSADSEDSTVSIQIKLENEGSDEELETDILYSPQIALKLALTEWLSEFGVPHQYNSNCHCLLVVNTECSVYS